MTAPFYMNGSAGNIDMGADTDRLHFRLEQVSGSSPHTVELVADVSPSTGGPGHNEKQRMTLGKIGWTDKVSFRTSQVADKLPAAIKNGYATVYIDGERAGRVHIKNSGSGEQSWSPDPDGESLDPANYAGIVHANNPQGIALAPALRREGASLGSDGATVNLPDGRTVQVGAIQDADEVARVIDGPNQGNVVESDQSATSSGSSEQNTTGNGQGFGTAAVVVVVLALGYYATQS